MNKLTIEIYGNDLPAEDVWIAVQRFVRETFDADWTVDAHGEPIEAQPEDKPQVIANSMWTRILGTNAEIMISTGGATTIRVRKVEDGPFIQPV